MTSLRLATMPIFARLGKTDLTSLNAPLIRSFDLFLFEIFLANDQENQ